MRRLPFLGKNRGQTPAKRVNDGAGVCPRFLGDNQEAQDIFYNWLRENNLDDPEYKSLKFNSDNVK